MTAHLDNPKKRRRPKPSPGCEAFDKLYQEELAKLGITDKLPIGRYSKRQRGLGQP